MKELKGKKDAELAKELKDTKDALRQFRFGISGSKTKNVKEGKNLRKRIAQINTELSARRLEK